MNDWYYCQSCSAELKESQANVEPFFDEVNSRVDKLVYCTYCNSESPMLNMVEHNMQTPDMHQEAEFWLIKKEETERVLRQIESKLEECWHGQ